MASRVIRRSAYALPHVGDKALAHLLQLCGGPRGAYRRTLFTDGYQAPVAALDRGDSNMAKYIGAQRMDIVDVGDGELN